MATYEIQSMTIRGVAGPVKLSHTKAGVCISCGQVVVNYPRKGDVNVSGEMGRIVAGLIYGTWGEDRKSPRCSTGDSIEIECLLDDIAGESFAEEIRVDVNARCPNCQEDDPDRLIWLDDETVDCGTCGHNYMPPTGT